MQHDHKTPSRKLGLESLKRTIVVRSFMHTEAINTEFVVVELLREDGTVSLVRAYVVDSISSGSDKGRI